MRWVISDAIEKVFISFFYYLGYRGFISRVQVLLTAATQKTFKALPVRAVVKPHQVFELNYSLDSIQFNFIVKLA